MTPTAASDAGWPAAWGPEEKLLVLAARVRMEPENASLFKSLALGGLDWERLFELASLHGLRPLLYHHLQDICPEAPSGPVFGRLKEHFRAAAGRSLLLTRELIRLTSLFEGHGIPVVSYKGPVLASEAYGNLAFREFADLDLLVREEDVWRARGLLLAEGYSAGYPLTAGQEAFHLRTNNEYKFVREADDLHVDLHWKLLPTYFHYPVEDEELWRRLETISIGGAKLKTLSAEDHLLVLCAHGVFHLWGRLEWICGVAELVRVRRDMDWGRVLSRARALGGERILLVGLRMAERILEAPLPGEVSRAVAADPAGRALAGKLTERLFAGDGGSESRVLEKAYYHMRVMGRLSSGASYIIRLATTPNRGDWSLLALPESLFFLYYAVRPVRLASGLARQAVARLFSR